MFTPLESIEKQCSHKICANFVLGFFGSPSEKARRKSDESPDSPDLPSSLDHHLCPAQSRLSSRRRRILQELQMFQHLRWTYGGQQFRQTAKTRTWSVAEERRHEIEARFRAADPTQPAKAVKLESQSSTTIERAVELFLSDKRLQGLDGGVLKKIRA